jgi:hypothetical protein
VELQAVSLLRGLVLIALLEQGLLAAAADWVQPGLTTNQPVWGIRGGVLWAVAPGGFRAGEPRGLIRLGYPVLAGERCDLINFIAIEPIVRGHRAFSELERSGFDGLPGKRIWAADAVGRDGKTAGLVPGRLEKVTNEVEALAVSLQVEPFDNGAHVRLTIRQRSDRPDEIELDLFAEPDSAALDYCVLTATMGNMARTRLLWLKDDLVHSRTLYPTYREADFAPQTLFPLPRLHRNAEGDVLVALTNDEADPAAVFPFPGSQLWHYGGAKVTQFWRKPAGAFRNDLQAAVNARYTYWLSRRPIPGGIAFENFELRERFYDGQKFVFGITRQTPEALGFGNRKAPVSSADGIQSKPAPPSR